MTSLSPSLSMPKSTRHARLSESGAIALFKKKYNRDHFWRKLHGNQFQEGLPDILWVVSGQVWFLEFKTADNKKLPWKKMRLAQHLTMIQMQKSGAHVFYMVYCNEDGVFYQINPSNIVEAKTYELKESEIWDLPF